MILKVWFNSLSWAGCEERELNHSLSLPSRMKSRKLQPCLRSEWGILGGGGRRKLGKMPEAKSEDNSEQQAGYTSYSHPGRRAAWISPSVLTNRLPGIEDPTHFTETAGVSFTLALSKTPTYVTLFGYCVGNHYLCEAEMFLAFSTVCLMMLLYYFRMHAGCEINSNFITVSMGLAWLEQCVLTRRDEIKRKRRSLPCKSVFIIASHDWDDG